MQTLNQTPNSKIIVWALFDDYERSYYKTLQNLDNVEVYSFGYRNPRDKTNFVYLNISTLNENLFKTLKTLPKPNIILASPPCESFSLADGAGRIYKSIKIEPNLTTIELKNRNFYETRNKFSSMYSQRNFIQKEASRINGESSLLATYEIIKAFNPQYWVIENPSSSLLWIYINHINFDGYITKTYYSQYDTEFSLKPTKFMSNKPLKLITERPQDVKLKTSTFSRRKRSAIPQKLILDIFNQLIT